MGQVGLAADSATVKRLTLFSYSLGLALDAAMAAPGAQDDAFAEKEEVVEEGGEDDELDFDSAEKEGKEDLRPGEPGQPFDLNGGERNRG